MKLQVLQENFARALLIASRFTSSRAQLPVLGNIFLAARKNKLELLATNLETAIALSLGAQVKEEGEITVPAKIIAETVANLSQGTLGLESEKEHLKLSTGTFSAKVLGMNAADFPKVPQFLGKDNLLVLPKDEFGESLTQVLFAAAVDETRPVLTGVLFTFSRGKLTLVATDGFRLSRKIIKIEADARAEKVIIPKNVLLEVVHLAEAGEDLQFSLKEKENQVLFGTGDAILSSRVLDGEFPDYEKIIPKESAVKVRVDKEEFLRAVKVASVFARDSANIVKISVAKDFLRLTAESSQSGSQEGTIDAKVEGPGLEIAFNFRFLEEFIKAVKGEEIVMEFVSGSAPGVFTDPTGPDFLHLIMPVKVQG